MKIYKKHFGKKLKEALSKGGFKQIELANALDVNAASVSNWINGKDFPDDDRIPAICKFLKVKESFFEYDQDMTIDDLIGILPMIQKIPIDIIQTLSKKDEQFFTDLRTSLSKMKNTTDNI